MICPFLNISLVSILPWFVDNCGVMVSVGYGLESSVYAHIGQQKPLDINDKKG